MDIKREIVGNEEAVDLFLKLEKLSREKPEVFNFFLSKYGTRLLDYYNWGDALWRTDEEKGSLDKLMPYLIALGVFINIIVSFVRK